jgi:hypothetical protein
VCAFEVNDKLKFVEPRAARFSLFNEMKFFYGLLNSNPQAVVYCG